MSIIRENVGKIAVDLQNKGDDKINPIELQRAMQQCGGTEDFDSQVEIAVERGVTLFQGNFFVVVLFKKERLLKNVVRQYFFARKTCPSPEFDQVVYKFIRKTCEIDFIWVVPDKQTVIDMGMIGHELPKEQQDLVQFARDFNSGELKRKCDRLNQALEPPH